MNSHRLTLCQQSCSGAALDVTSENETYIWLFFFPTVSARTLHTSIEVRISSWSLVLTGNAVDASWWQSVSHFHTDLGLKKSRFCQKSEGNKQSWAQCRSWGLIIPVLRKHWEHLLLFALAHPCCECWAWGGSGWQGLISVSAPSACPSSAAHSHWTPWEIR